MPPRKRSRSPEPEDKGHKLERRRQINRDSARRARDRQNIDLKSIQEEIMSYNKQNTGVKHSISLLKKEVAMLTARLKTHTCVARINTANVTNPGQNNAPRGVTSGSSGYCRHHRGSESSAAGSSSGESESDMSQERFGYSSQISNTLEEDDEDELGLIVSLCSRSSSSSNNNNININNNNNNDVAWPSSKVMTLPTTGAVTNSSIDVTIPSPDYSTALQQSTYPMNNFNMNISLPLSLPLPLDNPHTFILPSPQNMHESYSVGKVTDSMIQSNTQTGADISDLITEIQSLQGHVH